MGSRWMQVVVFCLLVPSGCGIGRTTEKPEIYGQFEKLGPIILDTVTGLEWLVGPDHNMTWYEAKAWVDRLEGNWRMPTRAELQGLWDAGISSDNWGPFESNATWIWATDSTAWDFLTGVTDTRLWNPFNRSDANRAFAVRSSRFQRLSLGLECGIGVGTEDTGVVSVLGEPEEKSEKQLWGATWSWYQDWVYQGGDLILTMESSDETGTQRVSHIRLSGGCSFKTSHGLGIGSEEAEVIARHYAVRDDTFTVAGEFFVAGSIYWGIGFGLTDGYVTSITMGSMAE